MKRGTLVLLLVTLLALGLALAGCGDSTTGDTPTAVAGGTSGSGSGDTGAPTVAPTHPPAAHTAAKLGEAVPIGNYTVSLDTATLDSGLLKAAFTFDNSKGTDAVNLRGTPFAAYQSAGGAVLDADIVCTTLPIQVDAGKKVAGEFVCWKAPGAKATTGMRVEFNSGRGSAIVDWDLP